MRDGTHYGTVMDMEDMPARYCGFSFLVRGQINPQLRRSLEESIRKYKAQGIGFEDGGVIDQSTTRVSFRVHYSKRNGLSQEIHQILEDQLIGNFVFSFVKRHTQI